MDSNSLAFALQVSGIGIVVLLLVLILLAVIVWLMTKYIVDKPEKTEEEAVQPVTAAVNVQTTEKKSDLQIAAAIALALFRAQTETQLAAPESSAVEVNSWRQFGLQRRLTQSSTIRRTK